MRIQYWVFLILISGCNSTGHYNQEMAKTLPKSVALEFLKSWDHFTQARCHFNPTTMAAGSSSQLPYEKFTMSILSSSIMIYEDGFLGESCGFITYPKITSLGQRPKRKDEKIITALKAMGVKG